MAFPPNYRQERNNRDRAKQQKLQEKLQKRAEKANQRKGDTNPDEQVTAVPSQDKD